MVILGFRAVFVVLLAFITILKMFCRLGNVGLSIICEKKELGKLLLPHESHFLALYQRHQGLLVVECIIFAIFCLPLSECFKAFFTFLVTYLQIGLLRFYDQALAYRVYGREEANHIKLQRIKFVVCILLCATHIPFCINIWNNLIWKT